MGADRRPSLTLNRERSRDASHCDRDARCDRTETGQDLKGKAKSRVEVLAAEFQKLTEQEEYAELTLEDLKAKREAKRKELVEESSRKRK